MKRSSAASVGRRVRLDCPDAYGGAGGARRSCRRYELDEGIVGYQVQYSASHDDFGTYIM